MKYPLILQDIDNKLLPKNIVVNKNNLFIKSYKRFEIQIKEDVDFDFENKPVIINNDYSPLDQPMIYTVYNNGTTKKNNIYAGVDANYSYTIYLGKTEKKVQLEIYDIEDEDGENLITITIDYKPNNILLSSQEHYTDIITNKDLPTLEELLPAIIIEENKADLIKRLLLDFREIKQHRGKLKSIEKFLYFIGFNDDNIKLYAEYIKPDGSKTINPNKLVDKKSGFYHVHYDNYIIEDDKYTRKNLPNFKLNIINFDEFFDKLFYALTLANDYFTIPEQQMSFFGISNMVNVEKFLSVTSTMNQIHYVDTINFRKRIHINIYNRTHLDSYPDYLIYNNHLKKNTTKRSEVKVLVGNNPILNSEIFKVEREFTDNSNTTDLTDEEQLQVKHIFGNVFHIDISSDNIQLEYSIVNINNQLIQYKSPSIIITDNKVENKIYIKNDGTYLVKFKFKDYHGNVDEYQYTIIVTGSNIDFKMFSSNKINEVANELTTDIDSPLETNNNISSGNLRLIDSGSNADLLTDLSNYFQVTNDYDTVKLLSEKQFRLPNLNHNTLMSNLSETLNTDFVDNFLQLIAFKKLNGFNYEFNTDHNYENEYLLWTILDIVNDENDTIEQYYLVTTDGISTDINPFLHHIKISLADTEFNLEQILNKQLPNIFRYSETKLPLNYDFEFNDVNMSSIYPRLNQQNNELLKQGDIVVCKIDNDLIINDRDIEWILLNSFTKEEITRQKQKSFKFRIEDNLLYDIVVNMNINNQQHQITKKSAITSFL